MGDKCTAPGLSFEDCVPHSDFALCLKCVVLRQGLEIGRRQRQLVMFVKMDSECDDAAGGDTQASAGSLHLRHVCATNGKLTLQAAGSATTTSNRSRPTEPPEPFRASQILPCVSA